MKLTQTEINIHSHYLRAHHAIELGRYDLAIELMGEVLRLTPEDSEALIILSQAHYCKYQYEQALRLIEDALTLRPGDPYVHAFYAIQLSRSGETQKAEEEFKTALALAPNYTYTLYYYAVFLQSRPSRIKEALALTERLVSMAPNDSAYRLLKGELLSDLGRFKEAEPEYLEALRLEPEDWRNHNNYGVFLLNHRGKVKKAFEHFREAIRLAPTSAHVKRNLLVTLQVKDGLAVSCGFFILLFVAWSQSLQLIAYLSTALTGEFANAKDLIGGFVALSLLGFLPLMLTFGKIRDEILFYLFECQSIRKAAQPEPVKPPGLLDKLFTFCFTPFVEFGWTVYDLCLLPAHLFLLAQEGWIYLKYADAHTLLQSPLGQACLSVLKKGAIFVGFITASILSFILTDRMFPEASYQFKLWVPLIFVAIFACMAQNVDLLFQRCRSRFQQHLDRKNPRH